MQKKSHLLPFWPLLSKTIETDPNLLYFSFFLQVGAWKVYQSTIKVLPTTHKHQRNTSCTTNLCFMVEFNLIFQTTANNHILQFRSLRLHTDMRLLSGKWWPKPQITNMTWLLYHLACHWRKRNQIRGYKFVSEKCTVYSNIASDIDDMLSINGSRCPTEIYGGENIDYKCFSDGRGVLLHHFWCCICFWTHILIKIPQ